MPRGRRRAFAGAAADTIQHLQAVRDSLLAERQRVSEQLATIEDMLAGSGAGRLAAPRAAVGPRAAGGRGGGRRGVRAGSLKDYIYKVLADGRVMAVKDITSAVMKAGYKTRNKTLGKSVGNALATMPRIKRVTRGKFRAV